jgi:hypothetical protein
MAKDKAINRVFTCYRILDLLPEPFKRVLYPFTIDKRQIDAEQSKQTVGPVFLDCCSALCSPTHPLVNAELLNIIFPQRCDGDLGNLVNLFLQRHLAAQLLAIR